MEEIDFTPDIPYDTIWQKCVLFFKWLYVVWLPSVGALQLLSFYDEKTPENPLWPEPYHTLPAIILILFAVLVPIKTTITTFKTGIYRFMKKQQNEEYVGLLETDTNGSSRFSGHLLFFAVTILFICGHFIVNFIEKQFHLPKDSGAHLIFSMLIGSSLIFVVLIILEKMRKLWPKPRQNL